MAFVAVLCKRKILDEVKGQITNAFSFLLLLRCSIIASVTRGTIISRPHSFLSCTFRSPHHSRLHCSQLWFGSLLCFTFIWCPCSVSSMILVSLPLFLFCSCLPSLCFISVYFFIFGFDFFLFLDLFVSISNSYVNSY